MVDSIVLPNRPTVTEQHDLQAEHAERPHEADRLVAATSRAMTISELAITTM
jgi:hypothetical protein